MGIFDFLKIKKFKQEIEKLQIENKDLRNDIEKLSFTKDELNYINFKDEVLKLENRKTTLENDLNILTEVSKVEDELSKRRLDISHLDSKKEYIKNDIDKLITNKLELEKEIEIIENIIDIQSYGFYETKYGLEDSSLYKNRLDIIKTRQKDMVKDKLATHHNLNWTIQNDSKKGKEFILDTIKLILRAFNNECDNIISKVKYSNVENSEKRIRKVYSELNKLTDMQNVSIKYEYLNLKIEELYLKYEYECKLKEEKEEQQAIKERMREEARVLKEIETAKKKIEKEESHFKNAIENLNFKVSSTTNDKEKEKLLIKLKDLEEKLREIELVKEDVINREKNTRAGYVYVISNIGSFGEDVYKIGMTRRLDPMDRIKELGSASVPFNFDVHAIIFSEDAPKLENQLHKRLEDNQVNKVNPRKEFFKVCLSEIEDIVKQEFKEATIEFTKVAIAEEFRKSIALSC